MARLLALLIALSTGVSGTLPAGDGYRCVVMNQRMEPGAECCQKCTVAASTIAPPCCEFVRGATPDARAPHTVEEPRLHPAPLVGILPAASTIADPFCATACNVASRPRGRPPGEQLHQLSQILRV